MQIGICSFSFHRLLAAGRQDIFKYITDCRELGCTQLDPWNAHLSVIKSGDAVLTAGKNPDQSAKYLSAADEEYIERVRVAAEQAKMPWGNIAIDGAHVYEADEQVRKANRAKAYRWIDVAAKLKAKQVRIDAGGPEDMPAEVFNVISEGYRDLISRAGEHGIEVVFENHWGPSVIPDNCVKLVEHIDRLGFLLDTNNWKAGMREEGRRKMAKYATATHIKTVNWDDKGNEVGSDIPTAVGLLKEANYKGVWGIESVPKDGDEYSGCRKTIALIKKLVA